MPLSCVLKSGFNGKSYIMHILLQKKSCVLFFFLKNEWKEGNQESHAGLSP